MTGLDFEPCHSCVHGDVCEVRKVVGNVKNSIETIHNFTELSLHCLKYVDKEEE